MGVWLRVEREKKIDQKHVKKRQFLEGHAPAEILQQNFKEGSTIHIYFIRLPLYMWYLSYLSNNTLEVVIIITILQTCKICANLSVPDCTILPAFHSVFIKNSHTHKAESRVPKPHNLFP